MDSSGKNRYELLFMDEDGGGTPPIETEIKKKAANPPVSSKKPQAAVGKKSTTEKENKAGTLNKTEGGRKSTGATTSRVKPEGGNRAQPGGDRNRQGERTPPAGDRNRQGDRAPQGGDRNRQGDWPTDNAVEDNSRSAKPYNNEAREQRNNRRNFRDGGVGNTGGGGGEYGNEQRPPRQFNNNNRDREYRGQPRNRFGENSFRGKREFDRQSGSDKTGVKSVDKRDGGGAHNWGSVKQEIEDVNKAPPTDTEAGNVERESTDQTVEPAPIVPEEEEAKEMTLDEWKAMAAQRAKPQYNTRKAGEGEDTSQWKKMVALNKKKEGGESEEEFEYDPSLYPQRVGRLQRIVDIQFNFKDGRRNGGGGGGGFRRDRGQRGSRPGGNDNSGRNDNAGRNENAGRNDNRRFEGGRGGGRDAAAGEDEIAVQQNSTRPNRNFAGVDKQRNGPHSLKVDDERQFPTLS